MRVSYGWWIVLSAFLNLFFSVGIVYYGFPVFYPSMVESLGFTRAQLTQGFLVGFAVAALLFGVAAGELIDRWGAHRVIRVGIWFVGVPRILMGSMTHLWQYYVLCIAEVVGYFLAGPIPNQVLISNWFHAKRGRAMGAAYLGLGLGGAVSPILINNLIQSLGWRNAFEIIGAMTIVVLFPIAQWVTRSHPSDLNLLPDGVTADGVTADAVATNAVVMRDLKTEQTSASRQSSAPDFDVWGAVSTANFWLILVGCTLTIGAIGTVTQQLILFLKDQGYSPGAASRVASLMLVSSLGGRVIVGYYADRYSKKNIMALFYLVLALAIPLLFLAHHPGGVWLFALVFGFSMGADYMLIPLVTVECFGLPALGKLLSLIIMCYSVGQWLAPWLAGKIFDAFHSYDLAWIIMTAAGLLGAAAIYGIKPGRGAKQQPNPAS